MHLLRWESTFLWSLVKIGSSVSENLVGQVHGEKKKRKNNNNKKQCKNNKSPNVVWGHITRFDCVWMQTHRSPQATPHIGIRACGCKFHQYQPIPHFKILLNINFHWNRRPLTIWRFCWQPFWKWWARKNDPEWKFYHYQPIPLFKILLDINFHWIRRVLTICRFCWRPFWKRWHRKNDPECNFHHYQSIPHFKITLDINFHWKQRTLKFCRFCRWPFSKWWPLECNFHHYQSIPHFKITLDINFHWNRRTLKFCRFFRRPFGRDFLWSEYSTHTTFIYMPSLVEIPLAVSDKSEVKDFDILSRFPWQRWPLWKFQDLNAPLEMGSTFLWSLVKIGSSVSDNLVGQVHSEEKKNNNNKNNNNNNKKWYDLKDH